MTKQTFIQKNNGDTLSASEWNELTSYVNTAVDAINEAGSSSSSEGSSIDSSFLYLNDKGNLCLETTAENTPANKKGKLNIESRDDIQIKPGDDIMLYGDHRGEGKTDEVSIKVMDGTGEDDVPAKLQVNMSEITLTTKDKTGNDSNVLDININRAKNTKGYLKVRAQAIDLRCEDHGGIALQPKGEDSDHNMNKIKFEHGGGDGLEFGTFNTEKTSIFTDEYRFNKEGVWKMATRSKVASDKADASDPTTTYKYVKQADDFYDIIDSSDAVATTESIIKSSNALNGTNIRTVNNGRKLSISTQKATVTLIAADNYENYSNVQPITQDVDALLGSGTLNVDYNIIFIKTMHSYLGSNNESAPYNLFASFASRESIFLNEIEDIFYISDDAFVESEPNALYSNKPTIVLLSTWDYSFDLSGNPNGWTGSASYAYRVENVNSNASITIGSGNISIKAGSGIFRVGNNECTLQDIVTLVNYFKSGSGQQNGPWANNL